MADSARLAKLSDLLHTINHDLRTPLGNIRSATAILLQNLTTPLTEEQQIFIEIIERSAGRLLDQSNRLLIFSQIAFDQSPREQILLSDLLATAKKSLKNNYGIEEAQFITNSDPTVWCHGELLADLLALLAAGDSKLQSDTLPTNPPVIQATAKPKEIQFTVHSQMTVQEFSYGFNLIVDEITQLHQTSLKSEVENGRKIFTFTVPTHSPKP